MYPNLRRSEHETLRILAGRTQWSAASVGGRYYPTHRLELRGLIERRTVFEKDQNSWFKVTE